MFDNFFERCWDIISTRSGQILAGLGNTLLIAFGAIILGIIIGTIIASIKVIPKKKNSYLLKFLEKIGDVYLTLFRGTPIVVQLLVFYFVILASVVSKIPAVLIAIVVFGLNSGAYVSEIMRSGILSVDKGQMEASRSLGLNYMQSMGKTVLPQAMKNAIPNLGNEFITLFKETSVAGFITVIDLTNAMQLIVGDKYYTAAPYLMLAVIYLVFVIFFTWCLRLIERRLRKGDIR